MNISKHCLRLRRISGRGTIPAAVEVRYRSTAVNLWHMILGRGDVGWETHYNASCFNALLRKHLDAVSAREGRRNRVSARALRRLDDALKHAGEQLSTVWVRGDPDHSVFRKKDAPGNDQWEALLERGGSNRPPPSVPIPPRPLGDAEAIEPPPRPWRDPVGRAIAWFALALVLLLLDPVGLNPLPGWWIAVPIVFAVWRALFALWESGVTPELLRRLGLAGEPSPA